MQNVRQLALKAIHEVLVLGRKPKDALAPLYEVLDERDRALLTELAYGVVRHTAMLDWVLRRFIRRPLKEGTRTLENLRAGVYQIFFMRVPEWAVLNEAVSLEKNKKGVVNAVLRNAIRDREGIRGELAAMREKTGGPEGAKLISFLTSHPRWLVKRWIRRFGPEEALRLAEANNAPPSLTLRVNTLRATREDVLEKLSGMGIEAEPTKFSPEGLRLKGRASFGRIEALRGLVVAQDEAAQMISRMLGPRPGERVLDACAAPGGKATHIAELMGDRGEVLAVDADEKRMERLRENLSSLGLSSVRMLHGDVSELKGLPPFDRALLDAPCSATGTIRRNPDIKHRLRKKDLEAHAEKQSALLNSVAALVRPGGEVLFCTCSTEPEEGELVVRRFLKSSAGFDIISDIPVVGQFMADGFFRTYPHRHEMDGFFGALLKRKA